MKEENNLVADIKKLLQNAQSKAYSTINFLMVETYWHIGKRIVQEEQAGNEKAEYGKYLIKELSKELSKELVSTFGNGYSQAVLWNVR